MNTPNDSTPVVGKVVELSPGHSALSQAMCIAEDARRELEALKKRLDGAVIIPRQLAANAIDHLVDLLQERSSWRRSSDVSYRLWHRWISEDIEALEKLLK